MLRWPSLLPNPENRHQGHAPGPCNSPISSYSATPNTNNADRRQSSSSPGRASGERRLPTDALTLAVRIPQLLARSFFSQLQQNSSTNQVDDHPFSLLEPGVLHFGLDGTTPVGKPNFYTKTLFILPSLCSQMFAVSCLARPRFSLEQRIQLSLR